MLMKMNYFVFGTNNMPAAIRFYDSLFEQSDISRVDGEGRMTLWTGDAFMFAVAEPFNGESASVSNGTMLGINVPSPTAVAMMHEKVLDLGGADEGEPLVRSGRYSAYVRDLDGNKICFYS